MSRRMLQPDLSKSPGRQDLLVPTSLVQSYRCSQELPPNDPTRPSILLTHRVPCQVPVTCYCNSCNFGNSKRVRKHLLSFEYCNPPLYLSIPSPRYLLSSRHEEEHAT